MITETYISRFDQKIIVVGIVKYRFERARIDKQIVRQNRDVPWIFAGLASSIQIKIKYIWF